MEKGTLIEFKVQGNPRLGVADRPEGKKNWVVIDGNGQSHVLHPRQITYTVAGDSYQPSDIAGFLAEAEANIDPETLEVAWEFLQEAGEVTDPASLALLLFSEQSPPLCYAAYCLLSSDKIFFKRKGDRYEPRSVKQVDEVRHQKAREAARKLEWEGFLVRSQQALAARKADTSEAKASLPSVEWDKTDRPRLELLERYATLGEDCSQKVAAQEILTALGYSAGTEDAFQLLVDLSLWSPHENLALRRSQIPIQIPDEISIMVQQRIDNPPPDADSDRLDLTHLKVYTIDDESTREIDDGLSLETLNGRTQIWVHIADPTRWLLPGDDIDLEARRRCTTVYLPTGMIPMFPEALATGPMSLRQGAVCCALSFGIVLSDEGAVEEYDIKASLIKPTYRLTYEDVDEMLELGLKAEPELNAIAELAKQRRKWRKSQGAISINMPESSIKVVDEEITIDVLENSQSRQTVAEMMILTGEVAARYGEAHALAIPFRSQPEPELPSDNELLQLPSGWVRDSAIRRCMPRSEMGINPARHATLGLDYYSQVTSPIRRYTDLLAHFQLKAHLRGERLPFSPEEMTELTQGVATAAYEAVTVERQTKRYWALEFLRREGNHTWAVMLLRWLREHENLGLVIIEDLGLELPMRFETPPTLGERFDIRVVHANPRQDFIRLEVVPDDVVASEAVA
ncbi:VacB/RNase II family 3'-5' exoribonuclease [Leptolyngbya cf. ectocarpi LEGE 11479]|uniref:VacB/RNase II family 3'-5' exoribonuclease n=1 Tax=Leptolyngbya cf. ectocarpi LEGE 11479 TaxID=1828722 RepID=A0A928ZV02_LEPEC|nr:ribonuclease R family protein [Leptolyngbya ectocarpi]MBE9067963.1 VacB/RNase II family 3'-5' exoribonuclease [Leptolyngbya cf. ectocarpi LEGE 11479]